MGRGIGCRQTLTSQTLRERPIALRHEDMTQHALPHHPNTPEGLAAYQAQVIAWHAKNPNQRPNEQHPYPLTPGTVGVGSHECWGCGQQGHAQGAPVCAGAILPDYEQEWRRIAGFIARAYNKERFVASQQVNYIAYSPYMQYPAYSQHQMYPSSAYDGDIDDGQGNGQGLSA